MTAKTKVLDAIEQLGPQELLKVADFLETLQPAEQAEARTANGADYLAVREASSGLGPMSDEIQRGREDRV